jgi:3'-phosphoadenosine 5'-phosphosulfate sulfotransferase (PAPS reductase)/FAD synthetase
MLTSEQIAELKAKINGRRVVASVSGGKDSAAMSLYLTELGINHDRVFMDTGWEHEATYAYLRGPLTEKLGPITWVEPKRKMEELVLHKGMFPSRMQRFCTQLLKVDPMKRHIRSLQDAGDEVLNTVGIRRAESEARSKMAEWEWSDTMDCEVWRPLIKWTEQEVIDIHHRHGLAPNPLYLKGADRVGCWPCVFARKEEIRFISENDPERINKIRDLEGLVTIKAKARLEARGEVLTNNPAWFQARNGGTGECWPIDQVVQWSRTSRGGKQFELFAAGERDAGCMRWGLCETNPDKGGSDE